jgi:hypothetical protein
MARPIRIQYPGAVYHVMARGSHGQEIFQDDRDRQRFLETPGEAATVEILLKLRGFLWMTGRSGALIPMRGGCGM